MQPAPLERIQQGLALFNEGEYERSIELLPPTIEWDTTDAVPDGALYRGRDEVVEFWLGLPSRWEGFRIETERWVEGEDAVLMLGRLEARGVGSGVPVRSSWDQVWRIDGDEIVRCENYTDRDRAWRESGIPRDSA